MLKRCATIIILISGFIGAAYGATCTPGTYLHPDTKYCTICPIDHYCPGDNTAIKCPTGLHSSSGATDIDFCVLPSGKRLTLHVGDSAIIMRPEVASRPALATVSSAGEIFYAILSKSKCSNIKVLYNDAVLSICSADSTIYPHTEIDYIESTGTQYLDTGYTINPDDSAEIIMTATGLRGDQITWTGANAYLQLRLRDGWSILQTDNGTPYGPKDDVRITYQNKTETLYINQTMTDSLSWATLSPDKKNVKIAIFKLGNYNNNGTFNTPATKMRLYSYKLTLNGATVRDLVPVLDYNGTPCMFDKISGQYLYNAGTDTFVFPATE